jgi:hypothetical protein
LALNANGLVTVADNNTADGDEGTDVLNGVETLQFADRNWQVTKLGEFLVNITKVGDQPSPTITSLADGGFVVTWSAESGLNIYGQRYYSSGVAAGAEFRINTTTDSTRTQGSPAITAVADGGFVVMWQSQEVSGSFYNIYGQRYTSSGTVSGTEFLINTTTANNQSSPAITALADGGLVVTWVSNLQDGSSTGVYGQRYNSSGVATGTEFRVNTTTANEQQDPAITALADGGFVVSWMSNGPDGSGWGVYGQRYNSSGVAAGTEFLVNTTTANHQYYPTITAFADSGFVVSWMSYNQDATDTWGIYGQRYNSSGVAAGTEFRINTTTANHQRSPAITALADGGFVVSWTSDGQNGSSYGIYGQRYNSSGVAAGTEFQIHTAISSQQYSLDITDLADGGFVVTFSSVNGSGGYGVYAQRFNANGQAILQGITGSAQADIMDLSTSVTATLLAGGAGDDTYKVGLNDVVAELANEGTDTVQSSLTYTLSANVENLTLTGTAAINGTGNAANNLIIGNAVTNMLMGGAGNDTLNGGAGNDSLIGGTGNDIAYYAGNQSDFKFAFNATGNLEVTDLKILDGDEGTDVLNGVETLQFADRSWQITKLGEFLVNTTTADYQGSPAITALADGGFVVTWVSNRQDSSNYGIYGQRYNSSGIVAGSEFRINTTTSNQQHYPDITALADGSFVVTWTSFGQDASNTWGIYGQRYDSSGVAAGAEFRVNTTTPSDQLSPAITALSDGGFVVTWMSDGDGSSWGVYGQRYNSSGIVAGSEFRVNTTTTGEQYYPDITALLDGGFVVTWESYGQDGSGIGIYGQRYNSSGVAAGIEFRINTTTANDQTYLAISALSDGGFVVTWESYGQDGSGTGIYGQRYNSSGVAAGTEFRVNTTTSDQQHSPAITALSDGGFVVTWGSNFQDGSAIGIYGQRYNSSGVAAGTEFLVNTTTAGEQVYADVTALSDGGFVVTWQSNLQDGSSWGVYGQRFNANGQAILQGITGSAQADIMDLSTNLTAALLAGGAGDDTYKVGLNDVVAELANEGTDTVQSSLTYTLSANVENLTLTGTAAINGTGNAANNLIIGNAATNMLMGGAGNDTLNGGAGNDSLIGGTGNDIAYYAGNQSDFKFALNAIGNVVITDLNTANVDEGTDVLNGVETLQFADRSWQITKLGELLVNTTTADSQVSPAITALADGGFVVSWLSYSNGANIYDIYGQRYNSLGVAAGTEFRINTTTADYQLSPAITALADGGFVVTWMSYSQDGSGYGIYGQRYNSSGVAAGTEFRVNTTTTDQQEFPTITALANGGFVVTWMSSGQDGSGTGIYGQRYNSLGVAAGTEFRINTTTANYQLSPAITALADGGFVVTWESNSQDGSDYGVYGQRYNSLGVAASTEFRINTTTTDHQESPAITALADGGFVVTWMSNSQDGSGYGIYGQRYNSSGVAAGTEFRINTTTTDAQKLPAITSLADGGFVVTWESYSQDGSGYGSLWPTL